MKLLYPIFLIFMVNYHGREGDSVGGKLVLRADREAEEYIYLLRTDYRRLLVF